VDETIVGKPITLYIEGIENGAGIVVDPAVITLTLRRPNGVVDNLAVGDLTHEATGHYSYTYVPAAGEEGVGIYRFVTQNPTSAGENTFLVKPSAILTGDAQWPSTGPCHPWCEAGDLTVPAGATDAQVEVAVLAASDVMFQLAGRRWPGVCDRTLRLGACDMATIPLPVAGNVSWQTIAIPGYRSHGSFGFCGGSKLLYLPEPAVAVTEVRIDGDVLSADAYAIRDNAVLARLDGGRWPCSGRWWEDPAPLEVDATFGQEPPASGVLAAQALATELLRAVVGDEDCALSPQVRSVSREGVSLDMVTAGLAEALSGGYTGIPAVDMFVHAHNPAGLRRRGRILGLR
jgi:hypothetical protein